MTPQQKPCCEACVKMFGLIGCKGKSTCPCHQESAGAKANRLMGELHDEIESQEKPSWHKELEDIALTEPDPNKAVFNLPQLKGFIFRLREQARREGSNEACDYLEKWWSDQLEPDKNREGLGEAIDSARGTASPIKTAGKI